MSADPTAPRWSPGFKTTSHVLHGTKRWQRGSRTQFTLSIAPELLAEVDEQARRLHMSRASPTTMIYNRWLAGLSDRAAA